MPYAPIPYTTQASVERLLRVSNNKVRVGTDPGEVTPADINEFILEASMYIDSFIRVNAEFDNLPVVTYLEKPEITFAAPRLAAYFVHRCMYATYRQDQLGAGVNGWQKDAEDHLKLLKEHIDKGVYTDLSPATGGLQFISVEQFYQTEVGVRFIDRNMRSDSKNVVPTKAANIGPYNDGTLP